MTSQSLTRAAALAIAVLLTTRSANMAAAGDNDFYGFSHVLKGLSESNKNTNIQPTQFKADANGGMIELRMPDTAGTCTGDYRFTWKFMDGIAKLQHGKAYRFNIVGRRVAGNCENNTAHCYLKSSSSASTMAREAGIKDPGPDIDLVTSHGSVVKAYPPSEDSTCDAKIVVKHDTYNEYSYFSMNLYFSSFPYSSKSKKCVYHVVYVFRKNFVPNAGATPTAGPANCPVLYGLGVNIGILEYGSLENAKTTFLAGFIDHAVAHMKASSCIDPAEVAYLEDLKKRMLKVERSAAFATEISNYRQELTLKILAACECG